MFRKSWAKRRAQGEIGFDPNVAALQLNPALERLAISIYDESARKGAGKGSVDNVPKAAWMGIACTFCHKTGHLVGDCRVKSNGGKGAKGKGGKGKVCMLGIPTSPSPRPPLLLSFGFQKKTKTRVNFSHP